MQNWLKKRVDLTPNRTAVVYKAQSLTFKELDERVIDLAQRLTLILDDNACVAVLTTNTLVGYEMILALQQLGKKIVLLNYRLSPDELAYQLQDADLTQVLQSDEYHQTLAHVEQIKFSTVQQALRSDASMVENFNLDDVTTVMYTSGTTGRPKGVQQTFGNHFYSAIGSMLNLGLNAEDAWVAVVPIFHISGFSIMMRSLIYGISVHLFEHFDATSINHDLMSGTVTTISVVPTMLRALLMNLPEDTTYPKQLRTMLLGGGPADLSMLQKAQDVGVGVVQSYGMTETASQIIALNPEDALRKMGSVGKPLFPVELRIVHCDAADVGRVQVKSPTLTVGYLNHPEKYQATFEDGWFDTGDMGYCDDEGFLYLVGREGDMISSGGENIFPDEVETIYRDLPEINEIAVIGMPDEDWGSVPVGILELNADAQLNAQMLIDYGRQRIAHYKVPKAFYIIDTEWPKTASGKIQRYQLKKMVSSSKKM